MKQAIHIFKKDVRYLRYDIGITLVAALFFCLLGVQQTTASSTGVAGNRIAFFLPVTWCFLIARVIHAEAIPGGRQFWLTRPYDWKSLLGAKLLFILVFVNLPLLLADAIIIHAVGFSIAREIPGLLWAQVLLVAAFVLPAAAFSAITTGLVSLLSALFVLVLAILTLMVLSPQLHLGIYWPQLQWVKTYCLMAQIAAASAAILLWQYARRNTSIARIVVAATALLLLATSLLLPWTAAFALQTHLSKQKIDPSSLRIDLDSRKWLANIYDAEQNQIVAELPLRFSGLAGGTELEPNGLKLKLRAADGKTWIVKQPPAASVSFEAGIISLRALMSKDFYTKVKDQSLQLSGTLYFTLYGDQQRTYLPLNAGPVVAKGVGACSAGEHSLLCNSVFRTGPALTTFRILHESSKLNRVTTEHPYRMTSYSPFPAEFAIDPVYRFFAVQPEAVSGVNVDALEPLAHLKRDFEIDRVRLSDFGPRSSSRAAKQ